MKTRRNSFAARPALMPALAVAALSIALGVLPLPRVVAGAAAAARQQAETQLGALERGYRTGYSDGFQSGWRDSADGRAGDYRGKVDYQRADRAYQPAYGSADDYRDGYRQGFEVGYDAGFNRRDFDSSLPQGGVRRRGAAAGGAGAARDSGAPTLESSNDDDSNSGSYPRQTGAGAPSSRGGSSGGSGVNSIPANTTMRVELLNRLSTDVNQRGDRFEARVVEPREYEGAIVGGRLAEVRRPGKARGRAELQMTFDQIRMPGGDYLDFSAQVVEVIDAGGDESAGEVDPEGGVRGKSSTKGDIARVGAGAGVGAIIGGIFGGGKGAAIGAAIGGGTATGGVLTSRGQEIRLERGTHLRIRTSR